MFTVELIMIQRFNESTNNLLEMITLAILAKQKLSFNIFSIYCGVAFVTEATTDIYRHRHGNSFSEGWIRWRWGSACSPDQITFTQGKEQSESFLSIIFAHKKHKICSTSVPWANWPFSSFQFPCRQICLVLIDGPNRVVSTQVISSAGQYVGIVPGLVKHFFMMQYVSGAWQ